LVTSTGTKAHRLAITNRQVGKTQNLFLWLTARIIDVCGFFFRDAPVFEPPSDLRLFLGNGPSPVYIGFGSIVIDDPNEMTAMILEAIRMTGVRAVVSRGWSKLGSGQQSRDEVFYLGDCPHEWLFQRVAAVIHHGGAGTTACGLLNGRPTAIVPFFGE
jgi:UDP:flavonoid glycosyltransferase YjiC (YdhE family)